MLGFQTYIDYLGIKKHFTNEKTVWKENVQYKSYKFETYEKRRDINFFWKIESNYRNRRDIINHLISCFVYNNNFWIGDFFSEEYVGFHKLRMKRIGGLESLFIHDIDEFEFWVLDNLKTELFTFSKKYPIILKCYEKVLSLETISIIEYFSHFSQTWFPINPLEKMRRFLIYKYSMLLRLEEHDLNKIQNTYQRFSAIIA